MTDLRTISPAEALVICSLSAEFGHLVDRGRATECAALFAPDARLIFGPGSPKPGTLDGIAAIRTFLAAREAQIHTTTRHIATNFRLRRLGVDEIEADSLQTVFSYYYENLHPLVFTLADVGERFRRSGPERWLIQQRLTTPIFMKS